MKRVLEEPGVWKVTHVSTDSGESVILEAFDQKVTIDKAGERVLPLNKGASKPSIDFVSVCSDVLKDTAHSLDDLRGKSVQPWIVELRRRAMRIMRDQGATYTSIGHFFHRCHTSVLTACKRDTDSKRVQLWRAAYAAETEFPSICSDVVADTSVTIADLRGSSRHSFVCELRRRAMRIMRDRGFSYPVIGAFFDRDHSTVMTACDRDRNKESRQRLNVANAVDEARRQKLQAMLAVVKAPLPAELDEGITELARKVAA